MQRAESLLAQMTNIAVDRFNEQQNKFSKDNLKDTNKLAEVYKMMSDKLKENPLENDDAKILEMANDQTNQIMDSKDQTPQYTLYNLEIPKYLRLIANSPNSTLCEKIDALELLNKFAKNPDFLARMLADDFYVVKSAELLNVITNEQDDFSELKPSQVDLFNQEL